MTTFADHQAYLAECERERLAAIAYHVRCLELAELNGYQAEYSPRDDLPGRWWIVPAPFVPIVGCMVARVA